MGLELVALIGILFVGSTGQTIVFRFCIVLGLIRWSIGFMTSYFALEKLVRVGLVVLRLVLVLLVSIDLKGMLQRSLGQARFVLCGLLRLAFCIKSLLCFYLFYERRLVPMVFIVLA